MLSFISWLLKLFKRTKDARIVLLGLDAAGKTTLLYKLQLGSVVTTIPTIGFNVESLQYRGLKLNVWDIGGQDRIRALWRHYFEGTHAVIFLIDANDASRFEEAKSEIFKVMSEDLLRNAILVVMANKQDLPNAVKPSKLIERLQLDRLPYHQKWFLQGTSVVNGEGIFEGLNWLADNLQI